MFPPHFISTMIFRSVMANTNNIVFPLLVPLYKQEAELVEKKGWNAFEQFLLDNEVDNLSDMNRKPFVW